MSQEIFDDIDPSTSGTALATLLNQFKDAVVSGFCGTSRPTNLQIGGFWVDQTNNPTSWSFRLYTGTSDVEIFTINLTTGVAAVALAVDSFIVKKVSADSIGAVMQLVKQRIATNGQVLDGDVVGEIRFVGRTNTSTNPVVAKIIWTSTDNETSTAFGGTLSFMSTPDGSATLAEHFRFISGQFETVVPHKVNSQVLVNNNVATTATIAQLTASKALVEMTGSTATDIQGINSGNDSKVITIHNRSSAIVTLKNANAGAVAADRLSLPGGLDYAIASQGSAALYYCTTDSLWKLTSTTDKVNGFKVDTLYGVVNSWTSPQVQTAVSVRTFRKTEGLRTERNNIRDIFGNLFAWGANASGQLGLGDVTPRSSPVAVLGALTFDKAWGETGAGVSSFGLANTGSAFAWGVNTSGQLGTNDATPRSSPVAVVGGLKFLELFPRDASCFGLTTNNSAFAWGINTNGQLGLGNVTTTSSPGAVLGTQKFVKLIPISGANGSASVVGLSSSTGAQGIGTAYAWGINTNGQLGVGDVTPRSSPVAVQGGIVFKDLKGAANSSRYFFVGIGSDNVTYAWGANTQSNLGVGDQTPRSAPTAVLGALTFTQIVMNEKSESVMALDSTGKLYAWGDNTQGVLGLGDSVNRSSPVAVLGGLSFTKVKLYKNMAVGWTSDGTLYSWGTNANGQLGVGDVTSRSSPVAVLGGLKFSDVVFADGPADTYSIFAVATSGLLYSWGVNANGTLGLGDVVPRSSPVAVLGVFTADIVEESKQYDLAVTTNTAYTVTTGPGFCYFGGTNIGRDIYKIEIEYLQ